MEEHPSVCYLNYMMMGMGLMLSQILDSRKDEVARR
jgi:hypothetical protein